MEKIKKHFLIYKITNSINGKIYIGKHQTNNLDDGYFGSSVILDRAIVKYGKDKFNKKILYTFDNLEDMDNMEHKIVDEQFVLRRDTYNLKLGGVGGWDYINKNGMNAGTENGKLFAKRFKDDLEFAINHIEKIKRGLKNSDCKIGEWWIGKKHTKESKSKIGKANSILQKGKGNSQYGTCWIYNLDLKESKKIKKETLPEWIDKGWVKGRKIKFI